MRKSLRSPRHARFQALLISQRKARGLTQGQLAAAMGKPQSFVAKYEGGERRLDVIEFLDVAAAIGFDPAKLLAELAAGLPRGAETQ